MKKNDGFTMIGMLISLVIVSILVMMSLQQFASIPKSMAGGGKSGPMDFSLARTRMIQLKSAETIYFSNHKKYATWAELVREPDSGLRGYSNKAEAGGRPYVPYHDFEIEVTSSGFTITATPNANSGAPIDAPILKITESSDLEEIPQ